MSRPSRLRPLHCTCRARRTVPPSPSHRRHREHRSHPSPPVPAPVRPSSRSHRSSPSRGGTDERDAWRPSTSSLRPVDRVGSRVDIEIAVVTIAAGRCNRTAQNGLAIGARGACGTDCPRPAYCPRRTGDTRCADCSRRYRWRLLHQSNRSRRLLPVVPVAPVAPIEPVAPIAPVVPVAPVAPIAGATSQSHRGLHPTYRWRLLHQSKHGRTDRARRAGGTDERDAWRPSTSSLRPVDRVGSRVDIEIAVVTITAGRCNRTAQNGLAIGARGTCWTDCPRPAYCPRRTGDTRCADRAGRSGCACCANRAGRSCRARCPDRARSSGCACCADCSRRTGGACCTDQAGRATRARCTGCATRTRRAGGTG